MLRRLLFCFFFLPVSESESVVIELLELELELGANMKGMKGTGNCGGLGICISLRFCFFGEGDVKDSELELTGELSELKSSSALVTESSSVSESVASSSSRTMNTTTLIRRCYRHKATNKYEPD